MCGRSCEHTCDRVRVPTGRVSVRRAPACRLQRFPNLLRVVRAHVLGRVAVRGVLPKVDPCQERGSLVGLWPAHAPSPRGTRHASRLQRSPLSSSRSPLPSPHSPLSSSLFLFLPASSSVFQPLPLSSSLFLFLPASSSVFQHRPSEDVAGAPRTAQQLPNDDHVDATRNQVGAQRRRVCERGVHLRRPHVHAEAERLTHPEQRVLLGVLPFGQVLLLDGSADRAEENRVAGGANIFRLLREVYAVGVVSASTRVA